MERPVTIIMTQKEAKQVRHFNDREIIEKLSPGQRQATLEKLIAQGIVVRASAAVAKRPRGPRLVVCNSKQPKGWPCKS